MVYSLTFFLNLRPNYYHARRIREIRLADEAAAIPVAVDEAVFRPVLLASRIAIPVSGKLSADVLESRPPGTVVKRGETLVERWPESAPAPLAPGDGMIIATAIAKLSERVKTAAVLFEPDVAHAAVPAPTPPARPAAIVDMLRKLRGVDLARGVAQLRERGVWADRWSSPDLLGQLRQCLSKPADTILCNVLDDSPELLLQGKIAATYPVELAAGVLALAAMMGAANVWAVAAAYGDPESWEALRDAVAGTRLKLVELRDHYPQSHPSLLIHELTGRHARPVKLPSESGVLVLDAAAAVAVGRCFIGDEPMLTSLVALHEPRHDKTHWLTVPIGTPWSQVLASCSIPPSHVELRAGNPLREWRLTTDCVVAGSELAAAVGPFQSAVNPDPCIRCAWCVEGCPVRIQPAGLLEAAQQDDPYLADQFGFDACIECGICTYVCPSNLPILSGIRALRASRDAGREKRRKIE